MTKELTKAQWHDVRMTLRIIIRNKKNAKQSQLINEALDNIEGSEYYGIEISTNEVKFGWKGKYPSCALSSDLLCRAVNNWGIDSQKREIFIILEDNQ